ncbi:MAG: hypothetical protein ACLTDX_00665 [[Clostridium] innocuum]
MQALQEEKEMLRSQFYQIYKTPGKKLVKFGTWYRYMKKKRRHGFLCKEVT